MPVYGPPIPVGLLKCMQPKRVAHERSEGVLPFNYYLIIRGFEDKLELLHFLLAVKGIPLFQYLSPKTKKKEFRSLFPP